MVKDVKWFSENKVIYISIYNITLFSEKHLELSIHADTFLNLWNNSVVLKKTILIKITESFTS